MTWQLNQIAQMCSGELIGNDHTVESLNTNSRISFADSVFLALIGDKYDGHNFYQQAIDGGALGIIINKDFYKKNLANLSNNFSIIVVEDTFLALIEWAKKWRQQFSGQIVAISGSNGKTSTKEMLATVLSEYLGKQNIHYTHHNLNNHLGVPLTILGIRDNHKVVVIEVGINHQGEMVKIAEMVKPNIALITNVGIAHLSGLVSVADVAREKSHLYMNLAKDGLAIINHDDQYKSVFENAAQGVKKKYFGITNNQSQIICNGKTLLLNTNYLGNKIKLSIPTPAFHQGINALAVLAIAEELGVPANAVNSGFKKINSITGRMQIIETPQLTIINDAYNANPDSMKAAINTLNQMPAPRILVIGDMGELGIEANKYHQDIIKYADQSDIEDIILIGSEFGKALKKTSLVRNNIYSDENLNLAEKTLNSLKLKHQSRGKTIHCLVKASRFMQLEQLIQRILSNDLQTNSGDFH